MGLRSFLYLLPEAWRTWLKRPSTVRYPFGPLELPPGFRGRVVIEPDNCRGCSLCVRDCPADALELQRVSRDEFRLIFHPERCAYCGQCELSCNFGAITLSNDFVRATTDRDTLTEILVDRKPEPESEA